MEENKIMSNEKKTNETERYTTLLSLIDACYNEIMSIKIENETYKDIIEMQYEDNLKKSQEIKKLQGIITENKVEMAKQNIYLTQAISQGSKVNSMNKNLVDEMERYQTCFFTASLVFIVYFAVTFVTFILM